MRYFGFDLGDGESCVALYSDQHIAPVILPVHGRNSFITALARYDGHPVVGALASDNPQAEDLRVCFKRNFRTNSDFVNQTVAAFAKGVLTALQDHSVVRHIMETEEVSFIVGCPADWADSDRTRYASPADGRWAAQCAYRARIASGIPVRVDSGRRRNAPPGADGLRAGD